jgi:phosphoribosylformylglycinamidine (FGAM) synthase PurS component
MTLEIAIDSIVPDNTAYTALVTLRRLGYGDLERIERAEILTLDVDAQPRDAADVVQQLSHAEVIFNPNKHRMRYAVLNGEPAAPERASAHDGAPEWEALVRDRDDETSSLANLLRGAFGITRLRSLSRGIAWRLHEAAGSAAREPVEWACRELLANQYSQTFIVRARPARHEAKLS